MDERIAEYIEMINLFTRHTVPWAYNTPYREESKYRLNISMQFIDAYTSKIISILNCKEMTP